jgi:uracil-DNA glycosylase
MKRTIEDRLGQWYPYLKGEFEKDYFKKLAGIIAKRRIVSRVYPESDLVFKAYELTNPKTVNCVVIGQDPYPTYSAILDKPVADGLAFSADDNDITPKSLVKLHRAIEDDCYNGFKLEFRNNLTYLAEQGVLLLNVALTVEHSAPLSHNEYGWKNFIKSTLKLIDDSPLAIITFGQGAKDLVTNSSLKKHHLIINVEHPAYACRLSRELNHENCFSKTNEFLKLHYGEKSMIKW